MIRHGRLRSASSSDYTLMYHGQERNLATEPSLWPVQLYGTVYQQQFVKLTAPLTYLLAYFSILDCLHHTAKGKHCCSDSCYQANPIQSMDESNPYPTLSCYSDKLRPTTWVGLRFSVFQVHVKVGNIARLNARINGTDYHVMN